MKQTSVLGCMLLLVATAQAQIQVDLKFKRLQYISYEPVVATLTITNLAGRDVELHDADGQHWFGFEISASEGRVVPPVTGDAPEPALRIESGKSVVRKINLTPIYPVHDYGSYRARANVYFADLGKFFYSQPKLFEVTDARPVWQKTVGVPEGIPGTGGTRTFSLLTNRFPDHTSLYVRAEDKSKGVVYNTYSLGRIIAFDEPHAEIDRDNRLHVLHCAAPRTWSYSHIGLNGELLAHSTYFETKTPPRFQKTSNGSVAVVGGMLDAPVKQAARTSAPKLSARPANVPKDN
jgi:hypothetical protein